MLYGVEACPQNSSDIKSLDFTVTRIFMKIFGTGNNAVITECRVYFDLPTIRQLIEKRRIKFLTKYISSENVLCKLCADNAKLEISEL